MQTVRALLQQIIRSASILSFILQRTINSIPVLFMIVLVSFLMIRAIPGGPFVASGQRATSDEVLAAMERYYGLDRPLLLNLPGAEDWALLHFVDETIEERVEAVSPRPELATAIDTALQAAAENLLSPAFDSAIDQIGWYDEEGIRRAEIPGLLADLALIRDEIELSQPELATQIDAAIATYETVDVSAERVQPVIRATTRRVLYSDLFQSQFGNYLFNLLRFDFGPSLGATSRGQPVGQIIKDKLPISISLGVMAVGSALLFGIPLGVLAAINHNRPIDQTAMLIAIIGRTVPNIVLGPVLIIIFAVKLDWFPVVNPYVWIDGPQAGLRDYFMTAFLPVLTLGMGMSAAIARLTRASLLQVLNQDYIRTARAKGLRERMVIYGHAVRNSLIPIVTILGPLLATVLTGTFVVELVFAIPGLGNSFVTSVTTRDYNLLVGVTVLYSVFLVGANIMVDVVYTWLDPRIRF